MVADVEGEGSTMAEVALVGLHLILGLVATVEAAWNDCFASRRPPACDELDLLACVTD